MSRTSNTWPAFLVLGLGLALRAPRVFCRWDEWALHYAAYNLPTLEALQGGDLGAALTTWVGLHPPLYPLFQSLLSVVWPAPIVWLIASVLLSAVAVVYVLRGSTGNVTWLAALVLATDPIQIHYAAEVSNYPLMVALIGMAWWAARRQRAGWLAAAGALGIWTHMLAGVSIGLVALTSPRRWRVLAVMGLASLPLVPTAWNQMLDSGTHRQPDLLLLTSAQDAIDRFGFSFLLLLPFLIRGLIQRRDLLIAWSGTLLVWIGLVSAHIAAPHQFPYALALSVPAALAIGVGADKPWLVRLIVGIALIRGGVSFAEDAQRLVRIHLDQEVERGIDAAIAASRPGDAIVLVRGLSEHDDDKRHTSPVVWRFRPWTSMPPQITQAPAFAYGQPRRWQQRIIYTFDSPRPAIQHLPEARVFTVLYEAATMNPERVPRHSSQGNAWRSFSDDLVRFPVLKDSVGSERRGASGDESSGE